MRTVAARLGCLVAAATLAVGCIAAVDRLTTGWTTFDWTIEQHRDAMLCERHAAVTMAITVEDEDRRPVARTTAPCGSFGATMSLEDGRYTATLVLLDGQAVPVSATLSVAPFVVWRAQTTRVALDFPAAAFVAR